MLLPSPTAGTLCLSWRRWRDPRGKPSTVDRYSRSLPCEWRTSASGHAVTPAAARTTCTGSAGTCPPPALSPSAAETWVPGTKPGPLNPDHEGGGDRGQQVPPTSGLAVPRLQDQVPTAPPRPPSPAQATLHHQEAQHLLLGAGPPSRVCPNKT